MNFSNRLTYFTCLVLLITGMAFKAEDARAQFFKDLSQYGYFQNYVRVGHDRLVADNEYTVGFSLQQINLLFKKDFNASYSAFINIEAINSFSTEQGFGEIKFDEVWLRYHPRKEFSLRIGLQVPQFNNLNTIKNRTPLLPYIFRPVAYESAFAEVANATLFADVPSDWLSRNPGFEFTPRHAYLSANGKLRAQKVRFDYSFYLGNQEDFITEEVVPATSVVSGTDTTRSVLFGGRIGVRWLSATVGISATHDKSLSASGISDIPRNRLGFDLSFQLANYYVEAEYIGVFKNPSAAQKQAIQERLPTFFVLTDDLTKHFYYVMLKYTFFELWDVYGYYNGVSDKESIFVSDPLHIWSAGIVHRPFEYVSIKAQYLNAELSPNLIPVTFGGNIVLLGVSVLF